MITMMIAQEAAFQQRKLTEATRNLDAFLGEWVVLHGPLVVAHSRKLSQLVEDGVILDGDALFYVSESHAEFLV